MEAGSPVVAQQIQLPIFTHTTAATVNTTESWQHNMTPSREICVYIFSAITVATVVVTLFRSFLFFYMCMRASRRLHDQMFNSITRATMYFFNTNSSG